MFFSNNLSFSSILLLFISDSKSKCQSCHNNQVLISVVNKNRNKRVSFKTDPLCEYYTDDDFINYNMTLKIKYNKNNILLYFYSCFNIIT